MLGRQSCIDTGLASPALGIELYWKPTRHRHEGWKGSPNSKSCSCLKIAIFLVEQLNKLSDSKESKGRETISSSFL